MHIWPRRAARAGTADELGIPGSSRRRKRGCCGGVAARVGFTTTTRHWRCSSAAAYPLSSYKVLVRGVRRAMDLR